MDQAREVIRLKHCSIRTEESSVGWMIRQFTFFHGKRHLAGMTKAEGGAYPSHLATHNNVTASTQLEGAQLMATALWADREVFPSRPFFIDETEGCLPVEILLTEPRDLGRTWTLCRVVSVPREMGPPSLTNSLLRLQSGEMGGAS